jgi:hypothetical protein
MIGLSARVRACGNCFSTCQKLGTVADQNGLAATSTRTVIVEPAAAPSIALMHRPHLLMRGTFLCIADR